MGRISGTETVLNNATSQSRSLRTTVPFFVVKQLSLEEGDHIDWELDRKGKNWFVKIKKVQST